MKAHTTHHFPAAPGVRVNIPDLTGWIGGMFKTLADWNERHKSRRTLTAIDSKTLLDFGLNPADVFIEANKSFWEA